MAIQYLSGNRATGSATDRAGLTQFSTKQWVELGRLKLDSTGALELTGIDTTGYDNLMILSHPVSSSGNTHFTFRTGKDSYQGSFADKRIENGSTPDGTTSRSDNTIISDITSGNNTSNPAFIVGTIHDMDGQEKLFQWRVIYGQGANSSSDPDSIMTWGKGSMTNKLNRFKLQGQSSANLGTNSEMILLGAKNTGTDTSKAGFWQELADIDLSGGATTDINSGAFTAKKYLMVEWFAQRSSSNIRNDIRFNGDSSSNYRRRRYTNGTSSGSGSAETSVDVRGDEANSRFCKMFILNDSTRDDKLIIGHINVTVPDTSSNPTAYIPFVAKWNKNEQITSINVNSGGANYGTDSYIKVWGSD